MKKNLVVVNDFDYVQGGASKVAIDTANLLAKGEEYNVIFFCASTNENNGCILNENIKEICTNQKEALKDNNRLRGFINGLYNFKAKKQFKQLLKTLDKDNTIIHIHGWTKSLSSSVFHIADKKGFKIVVTLHDYFTACPNGGYFNYKKNEICKLTPLCFKCLKCKCDSRNELFKIYRITRQFIQNKIVGMNKKLENVISISKFSEEILKKTLNKNVVIKRIFNPIDIGQKSERIDVNNNSYFLYVGRISKEKGVDIFCEAISKLNCKGIVVGDGEQCSQLKARYPEIEFVGWKDKKEVREYMNNARTLIFPSRWYEGAPLTPLEAMSIGLPCIVSNTCAASEYIENGKNGFTFIDIPDLIEKIKLLNDKNIVDTISKNAYDLYWEKPFNDEIYVKNITGFYQEILEK